MSVNTADRWLKGFASRNFDAQPGLDSPARRSCEITDVTGETMADHLTPLEADLARHALGLGNGRKSSYRNHFVTGEGGEDHAVWTDLVARGLAWRRPGSPLTGGDDLFGLTRAGAEAALLSGERLDPKAFPQPTEATHG